MEQKKISWYSHIRWGCIIYHYSDTATLIGNLGMIFVFMGGVRLLAAAGGLEILSDRYLGPVHALHGISVE